MQGKTINGFVLQRPLGVGGMAEVWYAENEIRKPAAVKILSAKLAIDTAIVERFRTEAEIMVQLNHPYIRQVYGYGTIDDRPAIIMEYLDGDDLKARMKQGQRFGEADLEKWWNQLVDALNYTHRRGIVHRDIKPGNIFVDNDGNIKLLDFGIAKVRESISSTQTGQKLGTLMYMSPEQVKDSKHVDYHTDIYSLAVTFVHLLTGKKPYDSDTSSDFEISEQIVYKPLDLGGLPETWRGFLEPYLKKEPENRPALRYYEAVTSPGITDDEDGTMVETGFVAQSPTIPAPAVPDAHASLPSKPYGNSKPKTALWIGLGAAAAVVLLLIFLLKPKSDDYPPQSTKTTVSSSYSSPDESDLGTPNNASVAPSPQNTVPYGAVNGLFSVGAYKQVYLSKGNLQYRPSSNTWRFAENQWDYVGAYNANISSTYSGWIDLFSWGTGNNPTKHTENSQDYTSFYDWGLYGRGEGWRTPTADEWNYLFSGRSNALAKRGAARVNGVAGMVLLPDDWRQPAGLTFNSNQLYYDANVYNIGSWRKMEEAGAVFLPTSGRRDGTQLFKQGTDGDYWSSTPHSNGRAYNVDFMQGSLTPKDNSPTKHAFAVRLIKEK